MKQCEIEKNSYAFESMDEFIKCFKDYAEREKMEFNDKMIVEGNSSLTYGNILEWVECFGVGNVYFAFYSMDFEHIDEFYIDLKNAEYNLSNKCIWLSSADEISLEKGRFLRLWFD